MSEILRKLIPDHYYKQHLYIFFEIIAQKLLLKRILEIVSIWHWKKENGKSMTQINKIWLYHQIHKINGLFNGVKNRE